MTCQQLSEKELSVTAWELPLFHRKVLVSAHWGQGFHVALQCGPATGELLVQSVTAPGYLWHGVCHSAVTVCAFVLLLMARNLKPIPFDLRGMNTPCPGLDFGHILNLSPA